MFSWGKGVRDGKYHLIGNRTDSYTLDEQEAFEITSKESKNEKIS